MSKKRRKKQHSRNTIAPAKPYGALSRLKSPTHAIGLLSIVAAIAVGIMQVKSDRQIAQLSGELRAPTIQFDVGAVKPSPDSLLLITTFMPDSLIPFDVSTQIPLGFVNGGSRTLRGITVTVVLPAGYEEDSTHYPGTFLYNAPPGVKAQLNRSRHGGYIVDAYRMPDLNPGIGIQMYYPVRVNSPHPSKGVATLPARRPTFVDIRVILDALDYQGARFPLRLMVVPAVDTSEYLATVETYFDMGQRRVRSSMSTLQYLTSALRPRVDPAVVILPAYRMAELHGERFALNVVRNFTVQVYKIPEARWDLVLQ